MQAYNTDTLLSTTDDAANGVTLRADVHRCLDLGGLVFVPVGHQVVAHLLDYGADHTAPPLEDDGAAVNGNFLAKTKVRQCRLQGE